MKSLYRDTNYWSNNCVDSFNIEFAPRETSKVRYDRKRRSQKVFSNKLDKWEALEGKTFYRE